MIGLTPRPFIFIHIPKTAGTSIEKALLPAVTGFNNFPDIPESVKKQYRLPGNDSAHQHDKARQFKAEIASGQYFIFTIVRNPFERAISQISYLQRTFGRNGEVFQGNWKSKLMALAEAKGWMGGHDLEATQMDYLTLETGRLVCHLVGRFEQLEGDWRIICRCLGLGSTPDLPHIFPNPNRAPYQSYYDTESREAIAYKYKRDLDAFGYQF